jgi:hypothetical protein
VGHVRRLSLLVQGAAEMLDEHGLAQRRMLWQVLGDSLKHAVDAVRKRMERKEAQDGLVELKAVMLPWMKNESNHRMRGKELRDACHAVEAFSPPQDELGSATKLTIVKNSWEAAKRAMVRAVSCASVLVQPCA